MDASEYIETVTEQMRCKKARVPVAKELRDHLEDQIQDYKAEGMSAQEAEAEAVRQMGDAASVGMELDRLHRPRMDIRSLVMLAILTLFGGMLQVFLAVWIASENGGHVDIAAEVWHVLFMLLVGWVLMLGILFADYTLAGRHPFRIWIGVLGLPMISGLLNKASWSFLNPGYRGLRAGWIGSLLLLSLALPAYCGIVFYYRSRRLKGLLFSVLWLLPVLVVPTGFYEYDTAVLPRLICLLGGLLILSFAVVRGWFQINKGKALLLVWGSLILFGLLFAIWLTANGLPYQFGRIQAFLDPGADPGGYGYVTMLSREALKQITLFGSNAGMESFPRSSDTAFTYLLSRGGWLSGILLLLLFAVLFLFMGMGIHRQKNILGSMMSFACILSLLLPLLLHILICLTLLPASSVPLPFCSPSWLVNIFSFCLAGIYLSVYRNTDIVA